MIFAGCYLISGTFIIVDTFKFTAQSGFYFYQVDITDEPDWIDHKDDIDFVDAVGVELYITSTETDPVTFSAFVDNYSGPLSSPSSVPTSAKAIIKDLTVPPGTHQVTYAQSLAILQNIDLLKALVKTGRFDYYGTSTGNDGNSFKIDSAKVIMTFSGGK